MTDAAINAQQRLALVERIACYTVGVAGNENTCIGTGTLVAIDQQHLVITAEHVLKGVDVESSGSGAGHQRQSSRRPRRICLDRRLAD
jgi:hypothetical protein